MIMKSHVLFLRHSALLIGETEFGSILFDLIRRSKLTSLQIKLFIYIKKYFLLPWQVFPSPVYPSLQVQ